MNYGFFGIFIFTQFNICRMEFFPRQRPPLALIQLVLASPKSRRTRRGSTSVRSQKQYYFFQEMGVYVCQVWKAILFCTKNRGLCLSGLKSNIIPLKKVGLPLSGLKAKSFIQNRLKVISQANNGVGAPVHGRVALSVLFPPTIRFLPHHILIHFLIHLHKHLYLPSHN